MDTKLETPVAPVMRVKEEEKNYFASPGRLMWLKFKKHRMAMIAGVILIILYFCAIFAEFVAPFDPFTFNARYTFMPPQPVHFIDEKGQLQRPFTYEMVKRRDPVTFATTYAQDATKPKHYLQLF